MKFFILFLVFSSVAVAGDREGPKIVKTKNGNITNYHIVNPDAPKQLGCVSLKKIDNSFTPPSLLSSAEACVAQDDYAHAVQIFRLSNAFFDFDRQRVKDPSAHEAGIVLLTDFVSKCSKYPGFESKFKRAENYPRKNAKALRELCAEIKRIGAPSYYPNYMISHGMRGFLGNPHKDALVKNFDAKFAWNDTLKNVIHCPK